MKQLLLLLLPAQLLAQISLNGVSDRVIDGQRFDRVAANNIQLTNCRNITIRGCSFTNTAFEAISILSSEGVVIEDCYFDKVRTAVYAVNSKNITVQHNECRDVQGPMPRGQFVQFNNSDGGKVIMNLVYNDPTRSRCEDAISTYKSRNIEIAHNYINGGGPSTSGGGIMLGDGGEWTFNVYVHDNILVNPGQYGIAINAGYNQRVINNKVFSRQFTWSNVGMYVWRKDKVLTTFRDNEVSGNAVVWVSKSGNRNDYWFSSETLPFLKRENNVNAGPSESMQPPPGCGIRTVAPPEPEPCKTDTVYIPKPYPVIEVQYLPRLDTIYLKGVKIGIAILE